MKPLRVMVVDDEALAREGLVELLETIPGVAVVSAHADGATALEALEALGAAPPDVLCIDIRMPGLDGFDVVAAIDPAKRPAVIFVTAYDAFAIKAFEVNAIDYLLKPVTAERLTQALERARHAESAIVPDRFGALLEALAPTRAGAGRLIVREVGRIQVIATRDVDWVEGADYYVRLHVAAKSHLLRETLTSLEQRLDPARFLRAHRSSIVNLTRVVAVESHDRGDAVAVLASGARVKVMRGRREELERRIESLHDLP